MRFLVDAQLPRRLANWLNGAGHKTVHTLDLPAGNSTTDTAICAISDHDGSIVITKDADFVNSFLIEGRPARLLLVSTGNIDNVTLLEIFRTRLPEITGVFTNHSFVELTRDLLVIHE